jgi:hypothetical protein
MAKRSTQMRLAGTEGIIEDLDAKAREYRAARDLRMAQTKEEVRLKGELLELMQAKKIENYEYEEVHAWIEPGKPNVKVKIKGEDEEPEEEE